MFKYRKKVLETLNDNMEELSELKVGSEEYLNATKASNQLAETQQKLKTVDWMGIANMVTSTILVVVTLAVSEHSIIDTRPVQFIRSVFRH